MAEKFRRAGKFVVRWLLMSRNLRNIKFYSKYLIAVKSAGRSDLRICLCTLCTDVGGIDLKKRSLLVVELKIEGNMR